MPDDVAERRSTGEARAGVEALRARMGEAIIGRREIIDRRSIGLLAN